MPNFNMVISMNAHCDFQFKLSHGQAYIMRFDNYHSKGKFKPNSLSQKETNKKLKNQKMSPIDHNVKNFHFF